jgi:hypothetical protein
VLVGEEGLEEINKLRGDCGQRRLQTDEHNVRAASRVVVVGPGWGRFSFAMAPPGCARWTGAAEACGLPDACEAPPRAL